ncbi:unnamed protein product [Fusarium graminearum]|uniref:Chromosome 3, complete genome n=1 Tax=Gibberella zeae (strain ATCC MYA-4620 / CBS 123657 / FGSC 9075 / NRRL 31084 / PH-1) TaxID=229533 RepID=I1S7N6_GIBZE|nr:hypothetical protein FGSG_12861 [Fusarium graminearum PH-1]ESU12099.1 hypothetical protein FGSG_12861 [Fusarium graminearum PH-1]CEF85909.1 unnamed protein product [Fusarium graminearum]CZS84788.1 unnamed protein product [Fusarium graminearum]|eukprot:XP_011324675.1 hypothetical protein FGSG_12861 [Fusarium graminearum PH-1]
MWKVICKTEPQYTVEQLTTELGVCISSHLTLEKPQDLRSSTWNAENRGECSGKGNSQAHEASRDYTHGHQTEADFLSGSPGVVFGHFCQERISGDRQQMPSIVRG